MLECMRTFHVDTRDSRAHQGACDTEISQARERADANGEIHDLTTSVPSIAAYSIVFIYGTLMIINLCERMGSRCSSGAQARVAISVHTISEHALDSHNLPVKDKSHKKFSFNSITKRFCKHGSTKIASLHNPLVLLEDFFSSCIREISQFRR